MQQASLTLQRRGRARPELSSPTLELAERLRKAARTGRTLRLEPEHVAVLLKDEIYSAISALEAKEMRSACRAATLNDNDINLETTGCGSAAITEPGASAGLNIIQLDAASRGANLLLREEAALMRRRKKH